MNFKPNLRFFSSLFKFPVTTFWRPVTSFLRPMYPFLRPMYFVRNHEDNCANIVSAIAISEAVLETGEGRPLP